MSFQSKAEKYKVPAALAAAALTGVALVKLFSRRTGPKAGTSAARARGDGQLPPPASLTITELRALSPDELAEVLLALHVSAATVEAFRDGDVDGTILLQIDERHLQEMGVRKVGDRIRIKEFVARYAATRNGRRDASKGSAECSSTGDEEEDVVEFGAPVAPPRTEGRARATPTAAAATAAAAPLPQEQAEIIKLVVEKLRALYELFGSQDFLRAPHPKQREVVTLAQEDLARIEGVITTLPPQMREQIAPLAANLREVIGKVDAALQGAPSAAATTGSNDGDAVDATADTSAAPTAAQLARMLKHLHTVMESEEMTLAPPSERQRALQSILSQLKQIQRLSEGIKEEQRRPLIALCESLIAMASHLAGEGDGSTSGTSARSQSASQERARSTEPSPRAAQHASLEFLTKRYRALFDAMRQEGVIQAEPRARQALIHKFRRELESLKKEGAQLPAEQAAATAGIASHIEQVIEQLEKITASQLGEGEGARPKSGAGSEGDGAQTATAATADMESDDPLGRVMGSLSEIVKTIKSPSFVDATPAARRPIIAALGRQLTATVGAIGELPSAEREVVSPMASQVVNLLQSLMAQAGGGGEANADAVDNKGAKRDAEKVAVPVEAAEATKAGAPFQVIVGVLRKMFETVKTDEFKQSKHTARVELAIQLMTQLQKIIPQIQALPLEKEQEACARLASNLMDLLKNIAQSAQQEMELETATVEKRNVERQRQLVAAEEAKAARGGAASQEGGEDGDDTATAGNEAAMRVVSKLTELFALIQSPTFSSADPRRQLALGRAVLEELAALQQEAEGFDEQARSTILPLIGRLRDVVEAYASAVGDITGAAETSSNSVLPQQREEDGVSEAQRAAAAMQRMKDMTSRLRSGQLRDVKGLRGAIALMDQIDQLPIRSADEVAMRQEFHAALMEAMQRVESDANDAIAKAQKEGDEEEKEDGTSGSGNDNSDAEGDDTDETGVIRISPPLRKFIQQFQAVQRELNSTTFTTRQQMLPFLQVVDELINAADEHGLAWKSSGTAVNIVGDVLTQLQQAQEAVGADRSDGNNDNNNDAPAAGTVGEVMHRAAADLRARNISAPEELMPFIQLLEHAAAMEDALTIEDLRALQKLQEQVIAVGNRLNQEHEGNKATAGAGSSEGSPKNSTPASPTPNSTTQSTPLSPQSVAALRVPPNTPVFAGMGGSAGSPGEGSPHRPLLEELEQADDGMEEDDGAAVANAADDESVLRMLSRLGAQCEQQTFTSPDQLGPYEMIVARVKQGQNSPAVEDAIRQCDDVIARKKSGLSTDGTGDGNAAAKRSLMKKIIGILGHAQFHTLPQQNRLQAVEEAKQCIQNLTDSEAIALNDVVTELLQALQNVDSAVGGQQQQPADAQTREDVPGALLSDLSLVPRIVERVRESDFCENTTLFEMRCIDMILARLLQSPHTHREAELLQMVKDAREEFTKRLTENSGPMKDPASVACPLVLTGQRTEDDEAHAVIRSLLFSPEEEEEFTVNVEHVKMFEQKPMPVADPSDEMMVRWQQGSVAVLVTIPKYDETNDAVVNKTALSEANVMHTLIEQTYGFHTVSLTQTVTSADFNRVIELVASRKPARVLLYFMTAQPPQLNAQHAVVFTDGVQMTYRAILDAFGAGNFGHAVVMHDSIRTFEVVSSVNNRTSPLLGVTVSEGAYSVANCSRCWLFDGLFTPIVADFLLRAAEGEAGALCAEDIVNCCISVLGARLLEPGSFVQDTALATPFLVPVDDDDDDEDEEEDDEDQDEDDEEEMENKDE